MRILVTGLPRAGKTTLAARLGAQRGLVVHHTDDLLGSIHPEHARARRVADWMAEPGPWIIEGCTVVRALRVWLAKRSGSPADLVVWRDVPRVRLSPAQQAFADGCARVWAEILPRLRASGVRFDLGGDVVALLPPTLPAPTHRVTSARVAQIQARRAGR